VSKLNKKNQLYHPKMCAYGPAVQQFYPKS
jgi:hypothetical protein